MESQFMEDSMSCNAAWQTPPFLGYFSADEQTMLLVLVSSGSAAESCEK
jgi:succinyl-CoA synthetase alpha subunit